MADIEPLRFNNIADVPKTEGGPKQNPLRVTVGVPFERPLDRLAKAGLSDFRGFAAGTRSPNSAGICGRCFAEKLGTTNANGIDADLKGLRNSFLTAMAKSVRKLTQEQPALPLVQLGNRSVALKGIVGDRD